MTIAARKDPKRTPKFRTERRRGLYMDAPPKRPTMRWKLVAIIALGVAVPLLLIAWLVKTLAG